MQETVLRIEPPSNSMSEKTDTSCVVNSITSEPEFEIQQFHKVLKLSPQARTKLWEESAVIIQKWVRGYQTRCKLYKLRKFNFRQMRKFRRMYSVAYERKKRRFITILKNTGKIYAN